MNTQRYSLELITACFCGGAAPEQMAEIRAPAIRGQLRWWFRVLGGFRSLAPQALPEQEQRLFGSAAGAAAQASPLILRVTAENTAALRSATVKDAEQLHADPGSPRGYLLFPLRTQKPKGEYHGRGVFDGLKLPRFDLELLWRGQPGLWADIQALATVFGHLGALGYRSRRAMGALAFCRAAPDLAAALARFGAPQQLVLKKLAAADGASAINALAQWLRKWRSHGRTANRQLNPFKPGFEFAKKDHDAGLNQYPGPVFRPALGLPIQQTYSANQRPVAWEAAWNARTRQGEGRFASPILLRPYRTFENGAYKWCALVLFADARLWPEKKTVYIDGRPRPVSPDLYYAMKSDPALTDFPG